MNCTPLVLYAVIAGAGTAGTILHPSRKLRLTPWYLGFVTTAAAVGLILTPFFSFDGYRVYYWIATLTHNALVCLLALEIVIQVLPRRFAQAIGIFLCTVLAVAFVKSMPLTTLAGALNLSISGAMIAGMLLMACVFFDAKWPKEHVFAAIGVALVLLGDALPMIRWIQGSVLTFALQMGDLPGVALLAIAAWNHPASRTSIARVGCEVA